MNESKKLGKNLSDIQEINRSLVLNAIRADPDCSRSQIAKDTGLRQATITKIVNDLIEAGIVLETSLFKGEKGRRSIGLNLNTTHYRVIGVRLTRSHVLVGLFDIAGTQYQLIQKDINVARGPDEAIREMVAAIQTMMAGAAGERVLGIGVGLPGLFLKDEEIMVVMADFPGWEGRSIRETLEEEFGKIVYTEHDAYASGLAEWWFGKKRNSSDILLSVSMEEGIGAGLVMQGKIFYGSQGIAGEIGHISIHYNGLPCACGNRGCLRNYCTESAVIQKAHAGIPDYPDSELNRYPSLSLENIIQGALKGDLFAVKLIREAGTFLGYGLMNAIYAYNPDTVVLSRQFAVAGDLYLDAVRQVLSDRLLPTIFNRIKVEFSNLTQDPVLMGVVSLVTDYLFMNPSYILGLKAETAV
jgi:predicted NBD/HSP70 family sugar kinase